MVNVKQTLVVCGSQREVAESYQKQIEESRKKERRVDHYVDSRTSNKCIEFPDEKITFFDASSPRQEWERVFHGWNFDVLSFASQDVLVPVFGYMLLMSRWRQNHGRVQAQPVDTKHPDAVEAEVVKNESVQVAE